MNKGIPIYFCLFLVLFLSISFVSANFFDWVTGNDIKDVRQISLESGEKYNVEVNKIVPAGDRKSFVRATITPSNGVPEEISVREGGETTLQGGEVVSVSKTPTNKPFGRKKININIEENKLKDIEGTLFFIHFHEDVGSVNEKSWDEYYLVSNEQRFKITPENEAMKIQLNNLVGKNIAIQGVEKNNFIIPEIINRVYQNPEEQLKSLIGAGGNKPPIDDFKPIPAIKDQTRYKMAVLLTDFTDSGARPFTRSEAEEKIFGNSAGSLKKIIEEQSYSKATVNGKVFDWIRVPRGSQDTGDTLRCGAMVGSFFTQEVLPLLPQATLNSLEDYDYFYVYNYCPQYQLNLGGYATLGGSFGFTMFNFNNFPSAWSPLIKHMEHEFFHLLGLPHSAAYDCDEETLGTSCAILEAGNCFDVMGKVLGVECSQHLNSVFKEELGWLSKRDILTIDKSGTYKLKPLEFSGSGFKVAKIEIQDLGSISPFYLEFRQPLGIDSNLNNPDFEYNKNGLFIYFTLLYSGLLDTMPTAFDWSEDVKEVTLNEDNVFFYNITDFNITIGPIIKANSTDILFSVNISSPSRPSLCGSTFTLSKPFKLYNTLFEDVYFINSNYGWAIEGKGILYSSDNGGNSWKFWGNPFQDLPDGYLNLGKIYFFNQNIGWIAGNNNGKSFIFYTSDGGETWIKKWESQDFLLIRDIQFINQNIGWMAGDKGVFKTTNGGETWQDISPSSPFSASRVSFIDANQGWMLPMSKDYLYFTDDGGETWTSHFPNPDISTNSILDISFINENLGWGVSQNYYNGKVTIFKTADGGQSWSNILINIPILFDIKFIDANNGWAVGYSPGEYVLFSTNDGGQTWLENFRVAVFYSVKPNSYFLDANHRWLNTGEGIYCLNDDRFKIEIKEEV